MLMRKELVVALVTVAALGCGLMGGLFFTFSNFVMRALALQPADQGIRVMQAINIQIVNPLFLLLFVGTPLLSVALAVSGVLRLSEPGSRLLAVGSFLYLVGALAVTVLINIPLNNRLAQMDPASFQAQQFWISYLSEWVTWNHVRTISALAASVTLITAIWQICERET
jgi:uncharacterized membrane protein